MASPAEPEETAEARGLLDQEAELRAAFDPGAKSLTISPDWEGFPGAAFGGFLAAAVLVAVSRQASHPRPLRLFSRYYRPAPIGRALDLEVRPERRGRTLEAFAVRLADGERLLSTYSVAFGRDGEAPLASQALPAIPPLVQPRPVWQHIEERGRRAPQMMRRVGFRGETQGAPPDEAAAGWHLRSQWPASPSADPAVRAGVAVMAIDAFVAPATLRANAWDLDTDWPVSVPTLDLTSWFYAPDHDARADWLTLRTSVPVSRAGYAVGRTQVWSGTCLLAEGMSQVALVPVPGAPAGGSREG